MSKEVILVIEDDPDIQELLAHSMSREGWKLVPARTGEEGIKIFKTKNVDCVLLDIMLPGMDGLKTLKKIKEIENGAGGRRGASIPVIMTTAKGEEADIVSGLELGADDYVVKPYSPKVLIARIRAGLRRQEESCSGAPASSWQQGELRLDASRHTAFCGERQLDLFATEFELLKHFLSNPEIVFSRNQIIKAIRGPDYPVTDRSVDVQILGLRKKLGEAGEMIETIRGVGYRFRAVNGE
ncbi:MAG: response regulator transcription factor [Treponema sp.]|jgi:two-component system phosphate regulon response regulator PhoB|nr:response regulator transcription factor [Treponema sp.]